MKDCCLRVWLLNLLNAVLSCPVWCLDNDALHEKIYLIYDLSVSQRMTVRRSASCIFAGILEYLFNSFFLFFISLSNISKAPWVHAAVFVPRAALLATSKVSPSKIWHHALPQGGFLPCHCSQAGKKTAGAWTIIQPNIDAVWAANSWLALSLPLFYCGAHDKYFKRAQELGLRCYQMFVCQVESRL